MNICATPLTSSDDSRYVSCIACTWHGPVQQASCTGDEIPCCPHCAAVLLEYADEDELLHLAKSREHDYPGYVALVRWSKGKSFPDFETLESAYRQAMEGQQ